MARGRPARSCCASSGWTRWAPGWRRTARARPRPAPRSGRPRAARRPRGRAPARTHRPTGTATAPPARPAAPDSHNNAPLGTGSRMQRLAQTHCNLCMHCRVAVGKESVGAVQRSRGWCRQAPPLDQGPLRSKWQSLLCRFAREIGSGRGLWTPVCQQARHARDRRDVSGRLAAHRAMQRRLREEEGSWVVRRGAAVRSRAGRRRQRMARMRAPSRSPGRPQRGVLAQQRARARLVRTPAGVVRVRGGVVRVRGRGRAARAQQLVAQAGVVLLRAAPDAALLEQCERAASQCCGADTVQAVGALPPPGGYSPALCARPAQDHAPPAAGSKTINNPGDHGRQRPARGQQARHAQPVQGAVPPPPQPAPLR